MDDAEMDGSLHLEGLPALPQAATVRALAPRLWADPRVVALWLGGSLASRTGDQYSDIDLRLAVAPDDLEAWRRPDLAALLGGEPLARHFVAFSPRSFLHHLIAPNGDILDLVVYGAEADLESEETLVLGCRDTDYAARLAASYQPSLLVEQETRPDSILSHLETFWVNSHKHRKVLHRGLGLMFPAAVYTNWQILMRLWYIAATGHEATSAHFAGIHGLTRLVRAIESASGADSGIPAGPLGILGMPCRTHAEICDAIERAQDAATAVGMHLGARYPFRYPYELEQTVRAAWQAYRQAEG